MASKKQIEANRGNAKKSTGPKTEEGKARSSMNGLKHGLTSQRVWFNEQEEKDFREFRRELAVELEPMGTLETQFVCRIASQMWRLARIPGMETELLEKMSTDALGAQTSLGEAFHKDCGAYDGSLGRLARYEAILDRSLIRLLNEYRKLQADRVQREKRYAEDWERGALSPRDPDFTPYDAGFRYPGAGRETGGRPPDTRAKSEANYAEAPTAETAAAARPSPAAGRPKTRKQRGNHGGNGMNETGTGGRARAGHAVPQHPPSV